MDTVDSAGRQHEGPLLPPRGIHEGDLGRIFPMADVASARLMKVKARCLCAAGLLPRPLKQRIDHAADQVILAGRRPPTGPTRRQAEPALPHHGGGF